MSPPVFSPNAKNTPPPARHVVAIAASAGGLQALSKVLGALPVDFPAAVVIVMHLSPDRKSELAEILDRRTTLTVREARAGDCLSDGLVFIAPPDHHLLVTQGGILSLSSSARVRFSRPSADVLFASVAALYGAQAVGVVLTGGDGDGSAGIQAIKGQGGDTIAQNTATSQHPSMPRNAVATGDVDSVLALSDIGPALVHLVSHGRESKG